MTGDQKAKWLARLNCKCWWHVVPEAAPACYEQRGRFYAATYKQDEFYGKPLMIPDRVTLKNPLIGDGDETDIALFGRVLTGCRTYKGLCWEEARRKRRALALGYDSIAVVSPAGMANFYQTGRIPLFIELCLLDLSLSRKAHPRDFMVGWKRGLDRVNELYTAHGVALSQILAA
jgi:hypothetical protein